MNDGHGGGPNPWPCPCVNRGRTRRHGMSARGLRRGPDAAALRRGICECARRAAGRRSDADALDVRLLAVATRTAARRLIRDGRGLRAARGVRRPKCSRAARSTLSRPGRFGVRIQRGSEEDRCSSAPIQRSSSDAYSPSCAKIRRASSSLCRSWVRLARVNRSWRRSIRFLLEARVRRARAKPR